METAYQSLMASDRGDPFDRHVFACAIAIGLAETGRPLTHALGLSPDALRDLLSAYFAHALPSIMSAGDWSDCAGEDQLEEPDLRQLLLDHRSAGVVAEEWLAAIIARRSVAANHLWQDLGLFDRDQLNGLMERHFAALRRLNGGDMKWKKFFYRQLCARYGVVVCKAPNCEVCEDVADCFGGEAGEPLSVLQGSVLRIRQTGRAD